MRVRQRPLTIHLRKNSKKAASFLTAISKLHMEMVTIGNEDGVKRKADCFRASTIVLGFMVAYTYLPIG